MPYSVCDVGPKQFDSSVPALQKMKHDSELLNRTEERLNDGGASPPWYSAGYSSNNLLEPLPILAKNLRSEVDELLQRPLNDEERYWFGQTFSHYLPDDRFLEEYREEIDRLEVQDSFWQSKYNSGRVGSKMKIIAQHAIKARWTQMGVWNPEWGMWCGTKWQGDRDVPCPSVKELCSWSKENRWPPRDHELPAERAVRLFLQKTNAWSECSEPLSNDLPANDHTPDIERFITSRPWYQWALEVAEQQRRLARLDIRDIHAYRLEANSMVKARWQKRGDWKSSWNDIPGWKWANEAPSPSPEQFSEMELTPAEIDAIEALPPLTPPELPIFEPKSTSSPNGLFGFSLNKTESQHQPSTHSEHNGSSATLPQTTEESGLQDLDYDAFGASPAEYGSSSSELLTNESLANEQQTDNKNQPPQSTNSHASSASQSKEMCK